MVQKIHLQGVIWVPRSPMWADQLKKIDSSSVHILSSPCINLSLEMRTFWIKNCIQIWCSECILILLIFQFRSTLFFDFFVCFLMMFFPSNICQFAAPLIHVKMYTTFFLPFHSFFLTSIPNRSAILLSLVFYRQRSMINEFSSFKLNYSSVPRSECTKYKCRTKWSKQMSKHY